MDFPSAIRALAGNPHFIAILPSGPMIVATAGNRLVDVRGKNAHTYVPKFSDIVSIAWEVMTREQFAKLIAQAQEAAQKG